MIDDKLKSNNISQHFNSFEEYKNNAILAVLGGYIPTVCIKKGMLYEPTDIIENQIYLHKISEKDKELLFRPFSVNEIILNNAENYGTLGLPCDINGYKIVTTKEVTIKENEIVGKKDKSSYGRIYPNPTHKCIADLIKHFYEYIYVENTGFIWTDNEQIHKRQFMYERLKVNFHETVGDSYGLFKQILTALVEIKNNGIENSAELLLIEEQLNKVLLKEQELLK